MWKREETTFLGIMGSECLVVFIANSGLEIYTENVVVESFKKVIIPAQLGISLHSTRLRLKCEKMMPIISSQSKSSLICDNCVHCS